MDGLKKQEKHQISYIGNYGLKWVAYVCLEFISDHGSNLE